MTKRSEEKGEAATVSPAQQTKKPDAGELSEQDLANTVGGDAAPKENVTFEYGGLQVRYTPQN